MVDSKHCANKKKGMSTEVLPPKTVQRKANQAKENKDIYPIWEISSGWNQSTQTQWFLHSNMPRHTDKYMYILYMQEKKNIVRTLIPSHGSQVQPLYKAKLSSSAKQLCSSLHNQLPLSFRKHKHF